MPSKQREERLRKHLNESKRQNWEEKVKSRNEAVRQRRIAVRQHWKKKTSDLKENPRNFSKLLNCFLDLGRGSWELILT